MSGNFVHYFTTFWLFTLLPVTIPRVWNPRQKPAIVHKGTLLDELLILIKPLVVDVKVLLVMEGPCNVDIFPKLAAHVHSLLSDEKSLVSHSEVFVFHLVSRLSGRKALILTLSLEQSASLSGSVNLDTRRPVVCHRELPLTRSPPSVTDMSHLRSRSWGKLFKQDKVF